MEETDKYSTCRTFKARAKNVSELRVSVYWVLSFMGEGSEELSMAEMSIGTAVGQTGKQQVTRT